MSSEPGDLLQVSMKGVGLGARVWDHGFGGSELGERSELVGADIWGVCVAGVAVEVDGHRRNGYGLI